MPDTPAAPLPVDFKAILSLEDFSLFVTHARAFGNTITFESRERWGALLSGYMNPALRRFLSSLRDDGHLKPIPGSAGRRNRFMESWNVIVTRSEAPESVWKEVLSKLSHSLAYFAAREAARSIENGTPFNQACLESYEKMARTINAGNFPWWSYSHNETCSVTGDYMMVDIAGWNVRIGHPGAKDEFHVMQDVQHPAVIEEQIELKTGNLLVTDWFKIEEFTKIVDAGGHERRPITCVMGREDETRYYLSQFGFVSVHVGKSSPSITEVDGELVIGHVADTEDDETDIPEDAKLLGSIFTEVRCVTMIEQEKLVEVLARSLGQQEADRKVSEYLDRHNSDVKRIKVSPGTYHLYFSGDYGEFGERFRSPDLAIDKRIDPIFILSSRKLELSDLLDDVSDPTPRLG